MISLFLFWLTRVLLNLILLVVRKLIPTLRSSNLILKLIKDVLKPWIKQILSEVKERAIKFLKNLYLQLIKQLK